MMNIKRVIVLAGFLAIFVTVSIAAVTSSDNHRRYNSRSAHGVWCYQPLDEPRPENFEFTYIDMMPNLFATASYDSYWYGAITGESQDNGLLLWREPQTGPAAFVDLIAFDSAVVKDKTGPLEMHVFGAGDVTDWFGEWYITDAGDELEGLEGYGVWFGPVEGEECDEGFFGAYYRVKKLFWPPFKDDG